MVHILNCQIRSRAYAKEPYLVHGYLSKTPSPLSSTQMWLNFFFFFARTRPICFIEKGTGTQHQELH